MVSIGANEEGREPQMTQRPRMEEDLDSSFYYLCPSVKSVVKNLSGSPLIGNPLDPKLSIFKIEQ
jgi:hypothetical protein